MPISLETSPSTPASHTLQTSRGTRYTLVSNIMLSKILSLSAVVAGAQAVYMPAALEARQESTECPAVPGGPSVVVGPQVIVYPVEINNYYPDNTIININNGPSINIYNAPTYISTIVQATSTITTTSTVTTTATTTANGTTVTET